MLGCSFAHYCERLTRNPHGTLRKASERFRAATGHDGNLYYTLHRVCDGLNAGAKNIMAATTCLAASGISTEILYRASGIATQERFDEALTELWSRNLVTYEAWAERRLNVHELVRAYFRENSHRARLHKVTAQTVHALTAQMAGCNERMDWSAARLEIEHCQYAAQKCRRESEVAGMERLLYEMGTHLLQNRNIEAARAHYAEGLTIARARHGEESLLCAQFLRESGVAAQYANVPILARKQVWQALALARQRLAPDAPELAEYYNTLGYVLKVQNALGRAYLFYCRALHINERTYGEHHAEVAISLNNIGALLEERRDYNGALTHLHRALAIGEATVDLGHALVAPCLNNIGRIYGKQAAWEAALACHQRAYTLYAATCEAMHPDLGACCYYLAEAQRGLGQHAEAERHYRRSLAIYEKAFGPEHSTYRTVAPRFASFLADLPTT